MSVESSTRTERRQPSAFGGFLALGAGVLLMSLMAATPAALQADADCRLTFGPTPVIAGGEAVEIRVIPSDELNEPEHVAFPAESGLRGQVVETSPIHLSIDPAEAEPGDWEVTLHDRQGTACVGILTVDQ
jgi:hypothetical protein